ncbi:MAG: FG-GAP repeat protein [Anaerolineae bacterium]
MARITILWALLALAGGLLVTLYLPSSGVYAQSPDGVEGQAIVPLYKIEGSATEAQDNFGWSIALDGDYLVVGAPHYTTTNATTSSAYIFKRGGDGSWVEIKELRAGDGQPGDWFGYAVAISGDTAVVGAPRADVGGWQDAGAAYVFRRDAGGANNWGQVVKLSASDIYTSNDHLGIAVAIDGNTIVVGAAEKDVNNVRDAGAVYVFTSSGTDPWTQTAVLTATTLGLQDLFGRAVTVDGDIIAVGAPWANEGSQSNTGSVYVFYRSGGQWSQVEKVAAFNLQAYDEFGISLALDGDTLIVGAHQRGSTSPGPGTAYVFERNAGGTDQWGLIRKLDAPDGVADDRFGFSAHIFADVAVVGAYLATVEGRVQQGAAYVFERDQGENNAWGFTAKLLAPDGKPGDRLGFAVAAQGNTLAIGAPYVNRGSDLNTGAVYVFITDGYAVHLPVIRR